MQFLKEAAQGAENPCQIDQPLTWEEGVERLRASGADLVLTHWGHANATDKAGQPCSVAEQLLVEMRAQDLRAPVIVFASGGHAEENRRTALNLGARRTPLSGRSCSGSSSECFGRLMTQENRIGQRLGSDQCSLRKR